MIMMDRSKRLSEPLRWGRREKAVVSGLLICAVLAVAALVGYGLTSGAPARRDCIDVTFASTLGVGREHACGRRARQACGSVRAFRGVEDQLREQCRRAGFPVR
ncbi:MAG TPA: hypothetical protein VMG62_00950 [Solirubrobacteraceae bacterium]|nr:hypothetical protein [Solirubrobacteraceae bacterium]